MIVTSDVLTSFLSTPPEELLTTALTAIYKLRANTSRFPSAAGRSVIAESRTVTINEDAVAYRGVTKQRTGDGGTVQARRRVGACSSAGQAERRATN